MESRKSHRSCWWNSVNFYLLIHKLLAARNLKAYLSIMYQVVTLYRYEQTFSSSKPSRNSSMGGAGDRVETADGHVCWSLVLRSAADDAGGWWAGGSAGRGRGGGGWAAHTPASPLAPHTRPNDRRPPRDRCPITAPKIHPRAPAYLETIVFWTSDWQCRVKKTYKTPTRDPAT